MAKYKSTDQVLKIIKNKEQIRNFGVIAHVDHGKTTMSDSLLAYSGIIAPSAAGLYFATSASLLYWVLNLAGFSRFDVQF